MTCNLCGDEVFCPKCDQRNNLQLAKENERLKAELEAEKGRVRFQKAGTVITISIGSILAIKQFFPIAGDIINTFPGVNPQGRNPQGGSPQGGNPQGGNPQGRIPPEPVNSAGQIKPHGRFVVTKFSVDKPSEEISIRADVDCQNCREKPLKMFLVDNERGQRQGRADNSPHDQTYDLVKYTFDGRLTKGRYSLVFVNSSDNYVVVKIRYTVDRK